MKFEKIIILIAFLIGLFSLNWFSFKSLEYGYCIGTPCGYLNLFIFIGSIIIGIIFTEMLLDNIFGTYDLEEKE